MKAMSYKGYLARVEFDAEDEVFTGRIAGIADVIGFHADTVVGLFEAFHEAVDDYLDTCARVGKEPQKAYSGNLMLRISPEVHSAAVAAADAAGKSLNQWGEEILAAAARTAGGGAAGGAGRSRSQ
jgi:predicted HicB family RNase H-like nuclease